MSRGNDEPGVEDGLTASPGAENVGGQPQVPTTAPPPDEPGSEGGRSGHVNSLNRHRLRRGLVWLLAVLAALSIVAFTILLWVHQVALNTDRFVSVVAPLAADPAVATAVSDTISQQVVDALDMQARLSQALPDQLSSLAAPLTAAVQDLVGRRLSGRMSDPAFPQLWESATRRVHSLLVRAVRDAPRDPSVSFSGGNVTLDLLSLAGSVLQKQQANPASPSVLNPDAVSEDTRRRLAAALDIQIPDDLGQVVLLQSSQLAAAQQAVRLFDRALWAVLGLTLAFIAAALALSLNRRRTVIAIGVSTVLLASLMALILPYMASSALASVPAGPGHVIIQAVLALAQGSLVSFLAVILLLGILVAVVAHLAGRPRWLTTANATVERALGGQKDG